MNITAQRVATNCNIRQVKFANELDDGINA